MSLPFTISQLDPEVNRIDYDSRSKHLAMLEEKLRRLRAREATTEVAVQLASKPRAYKRRVEAESVSAEESENEFYDSDATIPR